MTQNTVKHKSSWSIPGEKEPLWANLLGWSLVLGVIIMFFVAVRAGDNGYKIILGYSILSGIIVSLCAWKAESIIMLIFGIILFFLYLILVIVLGVNTP